MNLGKTQRILRISLKCIHATVRDEVVRVLASSNNDGRKEVLVSTERILTLTRKIFNV